MKMSWWKIIRPRKYDWFEIMKIISWLTCCIMRIGVNVDVIGGK